MGLLYSTLISCVGVLELVAFYFHMRRQLEPADGNDEGLDAITDNYKEQLAKKHTLTLHCEINKSPESVQLSQSKESLCAYYNVQHKTEENETREKSPFTKEDRISPSIERVYLGEELSVDPIHGRREASPFPTYERLAPRGSICELAENPSINVTEVDEEEVERDHVSNTFWSNSALIRSRAKSRSTSRSRSPSPHRKLVEVDDHRSKQYHKHIDVKRKKHRSVSPTSEDVLNTRKSRSVNDLNLQIVDRDYWSRSPSPFKEILHEDNLIFDDNFKNSLDGVKQKEKRDFKKKREHRREHINEEASGSKDSKEAFWVK